MSFWEILICVLVSIGITIGLSIERDKAIQSKVKQINWHTETPTEDGWYLVQVTYGYYFVLDINPLGKFMVDAFGERTELTKEDIECVVAYQKIEPYKA